MRSGAVLFAAVAIMAVATSQARAGEYGTVNLTLLAENPKQAVQEYFAASGMDSTEVDRAYLSRNNLDGSHKIIVYQRFQGVRVAGGALSMYVDTLSGAVSSVSTGWKDIPPSTSVIPAVSADSVTAIVARYVSANCIQPRAYPCSYVCDSTNVSRERLELMFPYLSHTPALLWKVDYECMEPLEGHDPDGYHNVAAGWFELDANTGALLGYYNTLMLTEPSSVRGQEREPFAPAIRAYPNPFNPSTTIKYRIDTAGSASVVVHNTAGQVVRRLVVNHHAAGTHEVIWNGNDDGGRPVASGTYFVRLVTPDHVEARAVTVVR
jgi:hypothetical protein